MDTTVLLNVVTAMTVIASPLLTSLFTHSSMSSRTKNAVAMVVSLAIAVAYEALTGGITDWANLAYAFPIVYGLQQAVYNTILKEWATRVEATVGITSKNAVPVDVISSESPAITAETPAMG